ncbi:MAG: hypothetical protein FJ087_01695 [Deltaproteobacteria bacterium]|nr:hypothetical protein [Deltaproteobacteria bacterium]
MKTTLALPLALLPLAALAQEAPAVPEPAPFEVHAQLHNLFLLRSDTDFDRRSPAYDEEGQTAGAFATVFGPTFAWNALGQSLRLFYEAEIGLNYWSRNNPDQENALAADIFVLKHRQIFAEGSIPVTVAGAGTGAVWFKAGYQYLTDTTALFLGHWIGAVQVGYRWAPGMRVGLMAGMIPDSTFEGLDVRANNFRHDIFTFGARADLELPAGWRLDAAVHSLYDTHVVGRTRWLVVPNAHLAATTPWMRDGLVRVSGSLDGVLQAGRSERSALDGGDQTLLAWAAQGSIKVETRPVALALNLLALSPDDPHPGNDREGGFFYSSKSTSATLYFTEDEVRNWYDQLDRRLARYEGGLWQHRAGLLVGDLKATLTLLPWFRPSLILGYGTVLQPDNALGHSSLGLEGNVDLAFAWGQHLVARVLFGGMVPGRAAGALMNEIAPQDAETDLVGWTEAAVSVVF